MTRAIARLVVRTSAWMAPQHLRDRWREEWLGEIEANATGHLRYATGAPWDALSARWTSRSEPAARGAWRSGWSSDVRQTLRSLQRSPGHVALVVVCLGIGLAASIAIFSIVNSLLFGEQAGIRDRRSIIRVYLGHDLAEGRESVGRGEVVAADPLSRDDFEILHDHGPALTGLSAEGDLSMAVVVNGNASGYVGALVSGNYFAVLGTEPQLGRLLTADDERAGAPVVVISDYLWHTMLDGRSDVVGQSLSVSGRPLTIVGIAPVRFTGIQPVDVGESLATGLQLWLPLSLARSWPGVPAPDAAWLSGIARLAPLATRADAEAQLQIAAHRVEQAFPATRPNARIVVRPHGFGPGDAPTEVLLIVALFLSVPLSVLAIGCANVANLQLARGTDRARELAVRLSLGATRWQVIRLLTLESVVLAGAAVAFGAAGAVVALRLTGDFLPLAIPFDWRVAGFALTVAAAVTIATGIAPAWLVLRRAIATGLGHSARIGGPAHARLRSALVVLQVALSLALLFMGALFTRSLTALNGNISSLAREIVVTDLDLRLSAGYSPARARQFVGELTARASQDSRIAAAGFADFRPSGGEVVFSRPSTPTEREGVLGGRVTPGWFDVMRARVLAGRVLTSADAGAPVAVVNATLAGRLAKSGGEVVGSTLSLLPSHRESKDPAIPLQIVGVIADPMDYPDKHKEPAMYLPMPSEPPTSLVCVVRAPDSAAATADLRQIMMSIDPELAWTRSDTIAARIAREISPLRYVALSVGAFGSLALILALTGLYAVLAYVVSLRRREIGVRVAIGAEPRHVMTLVIWQSVRLVAIGGGVGLALVLPLAFSLRVALFGISPVEPFALFPTLAALGVVAMLAAVVPARRAARIDPVRALRDE
ncbi:MAG TPA: ABC transporter permease [Vicinamibacterales bacterium]|nr:ABC transporter permease [Vicinamibacterales bacterium]